jgi:hypothetical protein
MRTARPKGSTSIPQTRTIRIRAVAVEALKPWRGITVSFL